MAFIRAKTIKGQKYAYLVENEWTSLGSRQKVKDYLGRIHEAGDTTEVGFSDDNYKGCVLKALKETISMAGFKEENGLFTRDNVTINIEELTVKRENKVAVISLNQGHLCDYTLKELMNFSAPEDFEEAAKKLANTLLQAGLRISPESLAHLFEIVKPAEQQKEEFYY